MEKIKVSFIFSFLTFLIAGGLLLPGLSQNQEIQTDSQKTQVAARDYFIREYAIGPRDLLEIKVFELPEFDHTVRVSEDGSITLPLIGNIQVGGLTKEKVEQKNCRTAR